MSMVIEDHECRAMRVSFKGEAKDFTLIADQVGQISRDCIATPRAHGSPRGANRHVEAHSADDAHMLSNAAKPGANPAAIEANTAPIASPDVASAEPTPQPGSDNY